MAHVQVETWKSTYRGMLPDERVDRRTIDSDIAGGFVWLMRDPPPGVARSVALTVADGTSDSRSAAPSESRSRASPENSGRSRRSSPIRARESALRSSATWHASSPAPVTPT